VEFRTYVSIATAAFGALVFPGIARANCAAEYLAMSQLGFERIPGDQIARQMYEMRRAQANSDLANCTTAERQADRERRREAQQRVAELPIRPQPQMIPVATAPEPDTRLNRAISHAVLDGRCKEAKSIALMHDRLDLAEQALRLCTAGSAARAGATATPIDPGAAFTTADYPLEALRAKQQGRVGVLAGVGPDGFVRSCSITMSSGSPSLDTITCTLAVRRLVFTPATDANGVLVASSTPIRIAWILPVK
jgi:TonB family protein